MLGPPCKPGFPKTKTYARNKAWELALPDDEVRPYNDEEGTREQVHLMREPANEIEVWKWKRKG